MVCPDRLAVIHSSDRSDQRSARLAVNHKRSHARQLESFARTVGERVRVRISLGVLELLGAVEVDLHGPLLWEHQDLRDARAGFSRLSAVFGGWLGGLF